MQNLRLSNHTVDLIEALNDKANQMIDANHSEVMEQLSHMSSSPTLINTVALLIVAQDREQQKGAAL